ncbi:hypothetical protein [Emcibacter sp.]|uniref:hypothetical protein n=1 Tax=Emcibacter sp. TaxID=1979954 RepID=UPI002AA6A6A7|nr:hypothetical protein [Emcibacter sp.]
MKALSVMAATAISLICTGVSSVQASDLTLQQKIEKCRTITGDMDRLTCYDVIGVSDPSETAPAQAAPAAVAPQVSSREQNFGVERVEKSEAEQTQSDIQSISSKVVKVAWSPNKQFAVYLENGQIWMQKDSQRVRFPDGEFSVEIKKAAMGSYKMLIPGKTSFVRVVRYK